jgi:hypothetical protein
MFKRALIISITFVIAACGGGGGGGNNTPNTPTTPTPPPQQNRAPVINSITVSPGFGVSELTTFTYSASASDPDGDAVTYAWNLAGVERTGNAGTITFVGSGLGEMRLTVSDGRGATATDGRTITLGSMTGTWRGSGVALGQFTMILTQSGPRVTGTYTDNVFGAGQIDPAQPGAINASGRVEMRLKQGRFTDFTFRGDMDQGGRRVVGQIFGSGFNGEAFSMDKQ